MWKIRGSSERKSQAGEKVMPQIQQVNSQDISLSYESRV